MVEKEFHFQDYWKIVRKHRWLALGIFVLTTLAGGLWTLSQVPIYQATAIVMIEPEPPKFIDLPNVTNIGTITGDNYYQTQYEVIQSRAVVERVIQALNLKQRIPGLDHATDAYAALAGSIRVEPKRNTRLVSISFESPEPALAAEVANGVANGYVKYNLDLKFKGTKDALSWLTEQMNDLRNKVQESSTTLQNYRVKAGILGMEEQRKITASKIMDFNKAYLESQAQRLSIEAKLQQVTQIAKDRVGAQSIYIVADNPLISGLKNQASDLEIQRSKALRIYKDKHPEVLKIDAQIQQINQKIDNEVQTMLRAVQTEYKVAKAREETLLGNVSLLRREGQELNEKEIQYLNLQRDNESNQQLYEAVLKRVKEAGLTGGLDTNNIRVIDDARPSLTPIRPRRTRSLMLSAVVGAILSVGVVVALEYFDTSIKSPDDIERYLGLPVIAIVPLFTEAKR